MKTYLQLLTGGFLLVLAGQLFAHAGPVGHMPIENNTLHFLLHIVMTLIIGIGVFFVSRWVIQLFVTRHNIPKR
ncbi:MAG: hypothetical protein R3F02_03010 [Thiolinea sp.]